MKLLFIFLFFFTICFNQTFSQGSLVLCNQGNQAILFNLQGLSDLKAESFAGGVGYQYYFMDRIATRLSFGMSSISEEHFPIPPSDTLVSKEISSFSLIFTPGVKYIFSRSSTIGAYIGGELLIGLTNENTKNANYQKNGGEDEINKTKYGAAAFLGIEWFAWENVSIGAEYKLSFTKESGSQKNISNNIEEKFDLPEKSIFDIGTSSYYFVLSFYF